MIGHKHVLMVSTVLSQQVALGWRCFFSFLHRRSTSLWRLLYPIQHPFVLCEVYLFADLSGKKAQQHSSWKLLCTVGVMYILIAKPFCLSHFFSWNPVCVCSMEELAMEVLRDRVKKPLCCTEMFQVKRCYIRKKTQTIKFFIMVRNDVFYCIVCQWIWSLSSF